MINEVLVFYAPAMEKWVLRPVSNIGLRYGDELVDDPTDEAIRSKYGNVKITREYGVTSSALMARLKQALAAKGAAQNLHGGER